MISGLRLGRAEHRPDGDAGGDRDAGEAPLRAAAVIGPRAAPGACAAAGGGLVVFIEAGLDQRGQRVERLLGVPAFGAQLDVGALAGAQHHQTHDRAGGHRLSVADHVHRGAEALGQQ